MLILRWNSMSVFSLLLVLFCPSVFQSDRLVEHRVLTCAVEVGHEITDALELQIFARFLIGTIFLNIAVCVHLE